MPTSTYQNSAQHQDSISNASKFALLRRYSCIDCKNSYNVSQLKSHICKPCPVCKTLFTGNVKKYCSSKCAAIFNNSIRTKQSRKQQGNSLKSTIKKNPNVIINSITALKLYKSTNDNFCRVQFINCKHCDSLFLVKNNSKYHKKHCSTHCATQSCMQQKTNLHGRKKIFKYLNPFNQVITTLESTWELKIAQHLDSLNISWIRPDPIKWIDQNLKSHLYYADFFLPYYNIYLDPKNPYVMQLDSHKMAIIEQQITIFYGSIQHLKDSIKKL